VRVRVGALVEEEEEEEEWVAVEPCPPLSKA